MIAAYKFTKFQIQAFHSFIWDLIDHFEVGQIQFYPERSRHLFTDEQLTHIGRQFDPSRRSDFSYVWKDHLKNLKVVTFVQLHIAGSPKVKMTIDLENNTLVLEDAEGITAEDIKVSFEKFFQVQEVSGEGAASVWWKYTHPVWWIWFVLVLIFRDVVWTLLKLAWRHKWISGAILVVVIPIVVGLCINYLTWKFGWR